MSWKANESRLRSLVTALHTYFVSTWILTQADVRKVGMYSNHRGGSYDPPLSVPARVIQGSTLNNKVPSFFLILACPKFLKCNYLST